MSTLYNNYVDAAVTTPILEFNGYYEEQSPKRIQSAAAMMLLALDEAKNGVNTTRHNRLMLHYRNIIKGGKEPAMDCSHFWAYPIVASAIALAKNTPSIWDEFTNEEVERLDFLMTCFAVISNFIANDKNFYQTGLFLKGDVGKKWNPNYKLSLVGPMIACGAYFGDDDIIDNLLTSFSYDKAIEKMNAYGYVHMLQVWKREDIDYDGEIVPGVKNMLEKAGKAYITDKSMEFTQIFGAGQGEGAKIPFLYQNYRATDIEILNYLLTDCYSGGRVFSAIDTNGDEVNEAEIVDHSVSPVEGQEGLMLEFNGRDKFGIRSDAFYCMIDFIMIVSLLGMLKQIGLYSEFGEFELYKKIYIGNTDLIYKLSKGYLSCSQGKQHITKENNSMGYNFMKAYWNEYFKSPSELIGE